MAYFYKGFKIVEKNGAFFVIAPMIGNRMVKVAKTRVEAKLWIETADNTLELRRDAQKLEKIMRK